MNKPKNALEQLRNLTDEVADEIVREEGIEPPEADSYSQPERAHSDKTLYLFGAEIRLSRLRRTDDQTADIMSDFDARIGTLTGKKPKTLNTTPKVD